MYGLALFPFWALKRGMSRFRGRIVNAIRSVDAARTRIFQVSEMLMLFREYCADPPDHGRLHIPPRGAVEIAFLSALVIAPYGVCGRGGWEKSGDNLARQRSVRIGIE